MRAAEAQQVQAAVAALRRILPEALVAIYLHGSAVAGGLRPQSDIDLMAVTSRAMTGEERHALLVALSALSGRFPRGDDAPRCLEVMVFVAGDAMRATPAQADFLYGEWLRPGFDSGVTPEPVADAGNTLILAEARQVAIPLFGPPAPELLPETSAEVVRRAMRDALPALLAGLVGDERNVLLTLARMWRTAEGGDFVAKDVAAAWAAPRLPEPDRATLDLARRAYLGEIADEWADRQQAAERAAAALRARIPL